MRIFFTLSLFILSSLCIYGQEFNLTVSQGVFNNKVELNWNSIPEADFYTIQRAYDTLHHTQLGKKAILETNVIVSNIKKTNYIDTSISFGQHVYIVTAYKTNISCEIVHKKESIITNITPIAVAKNTGYRTVTDEEFFLEFQKSIDSSLPRIRSMKMLNFFGEKKTGWRNGQLVYKTTGIIRRPFKVMIQYTDFIDQSLKLNGLYEVQIFKLLSQEGKLVGTFYVDGIYKGTVTHNLIIDKGQSVGGTYDVQQQGRPMVSLPWDITTHPLDDSQYEEALQNSLKEAEK